MANENPVVIDNWSRTKVAKSAEGNFCWTIEQFLDRKESVKEAFTSPKFTIFGPDDKLTQWKIKIFPRGKTEEVSGCVSIFLQSLNDLDKTATYKVSILDKENKRQKIQNSVMYTYEANNSIKGKGWNNFIGRSVLEENPGLLPDGNFVIFCEITVFGDEKTESGSKYLNMDGKRVDQTQDILQDLSDDFGKAFSESDCSDLHLVCGGKVFNCHEFVLSARSPVFRAMFHHDMTESKTKNIIISDFSPDVIVKMLQFIYSGRVVLDEQSELIGELLKAADKYELGMLKKVCEDKLCDAMDLKDSVRNLILGDMVGAQKLMKSALQHLASNMSSVIDTEEWKSCAKHHPALVTEVMRIIVDKRGVKRKNEDDE